MHAVLITFDSSAALDDLSAPFTEYAAALNNVDGLVMKAWLHDGGTLGGFHLFADRAEADAYLNGPLCAGLQGTPAFSNFVVRHFGVVDELSVMTGAPAAPFALAAR